MSQPAQQKLQTLKKSHLYIEFLFIRLSNLKFLEDRKSDFFTSNTHFATTQTPLPTVAALLAPPLQQYG
jgi:hypothetical protein